jgi:NCS1 family nucleobase:cation symporter-1
MISSLLRLGGGLGGTGRFIISVRGLVAWQRLLLMFIGVLVNSNISTYMTGSSLIALGLTWWQAIIAIVAGQLLATLFVILNSIPGAYYYCM